MSEGTCVLRLVVNVVDYRLLKEKTGLKPGLPF